MTENRTITRPEAFDSEAWLAACLRHTIVYGYAGDDVNVVVDDPRQEVESLPERA